MDRQRIDKWLWHARFYRTRVLAQAAAGSGRIRLNDRRIEKPGVEVKLGDVLTIPWGREVLIVRIEGCGIRRGAAKDARLLYQILNDTVLDPAGGEP